VRRDTNMYRPFKALLLLLIAFILPTGCHLWATGRALRLIA
jgi:hypothetical protein